MHDQFVIALLYLYRLRITHFYIPDVCALILPDS